MKTEQEIQTKIDDLKNFRRIITGEKPLRKITDRQIHHVTEQIYLLEWVLSN